MEIDSEIHVRFRVLPAHQQLYLQLKCIRFSHIKLNFCWMDDKQDGQTEAADGWMGVGEMNVSTETDGWMRWIDGG